MANSSLNLILIFVGVFLLIMVLIAGLSAKDQNQTTNTSDTQDTQQVQNAETTEQIKPFLLGLSGFQMLLLVVLIFGGIAVFLKMIFGKRH